MKRALSLIAAALLLLPACYHNAELARRAAEGDPLAQYEYARRCLTGQKGVRQDAVRAVECLRPAAVEGYAPAQALLALCYERGLGVSADSAEARRLYTLAAEQGCVPACRALLAAEMKSGKTTESMRWLRALAEQGNPAAQLQLGKLCLGGVPAAGTQADGVRYIRFSAMQGEPEACRLMAMCYEQGVGVPKNELLAHGWRENAQE